MNRTTRRRNFALRTAGLAAAVLAASALPAAAQQQPAQTQAQVPQNAAQQAAAQPPVPPLNAQQQQYVDQMLNFWAQKTASIERYRCDFQRWSFDSQEAKGVHAQYAKGILRFMKPDKGLFKVDDLYYFKGNNAENAPQFSKVDGKFGEWWLCDGTWLHNYDREAKKVERYELPPDMQGTEIYNAPLPFLFGIKAEKVKERYWLQPVSLPDAEGKPRTDVYVLDAYPKHQADSQNYSKVRVFLDAKEFLPVGLEITLPWHVVNAQGEVVKDCREVYEFSNREVNWNLLDRMAELLKFKDEFIPKAVPNDWQVIDHPNQAAAAQQAQAPQQTPQTR